MRNLRSLAKAASVLADLRGCSELTTLWSTRVLQTSLITITPKLRCALNAARTPLKGGCRKATRRRWTSLMELCSYALKMTLDTLGDTMNEFWRGRGIGMQCKPQ
eukprot:6030461-Amphidinium_carterae.1